MGSKRCAFEDPSERFGEEKKKKRIRRCSLSFGNQKKKLDLLNAFFLEREREEREERESETVWCSIHSNIKGRTLGLSNPIS